MDWFLTTLSHLLSHPTSDAKNVRTMEHADSKKEPQTTFANPASAGAAPPGGVGFEDLRAST